MSGYRHTFLLSIPYMEPRRPVFQEIMSINVRYVHNSSPCHSFTRKHPWVFSRVSFLIFFVLRRKLQVTAFDADFLLFKSKILPDWDCYSDQAFSRHHGSRIRGPLKALRTTQTCGTDALRRALIWVPIMLRGVSPSDSWCNFFSNLASCRYYRRNVFVASDECFPLIAIN